METKQPSRFLTAILFTVLLFVLAESSTDPLEVLALQDLYKSLNKPDQLRRWKLEGGDPCEEFWMGISCSDSSIVDLQLRGLKLQGNLGNYLQDLHNLKNLDVSFNNLQGEIPYGLPPNATHLNMAYNNLTQSIPFSLLLLTSLQSLNLSHNSLSGPLGNVFFGLQIKEMDLSFNNLTGDLPSSFGSLMNLTSLYIQNNRFTGSVIYLADLPLSELNIEDNEFSGIIPSHFQSITHLWICGNKFQVEANSKPWKFPLDVVPMIQNSTYYPTPIMSFPRPRKVRKMKKKKHRNSRELVLLIGGLALLCDNVKLQVSLLATAAFSCLPSVAARPVPDERQMPFSSNILHGLLGTALIGVAGYYIISWLYRNSRRRIRGWFGGWMYVSERVFNSASENLANEIANLRQSQEDVFRETRDRLHVLEGGIQNLAAEIRQDREVMLQYMHRQDQMMRFLLDGSAQRGPSPSIRDEPESSSRLVRRRAVGAVGLGLLQ